MDILVRVVEIGTLVYYPGETAESRSNQCAVTRTTTYQEERGKFTTMVTILPVSDEGDDLGKEPITVNQNEIVEI